MKKALLFVVLLVSVLSIYASSSPWALSSIKLGLGNDKYAYGLSRNDDDQLSYSEHITLAGEKWYVKANLNGITNRGWKTGWDIKDPGVKDEDENHWYDGRIDVTEIITGYNYTHEFSSLVSLRVSPETGFFLSGYTGYDFLQNTVHKLSGIHSVNIKYDYDDVRFHYYLGGNVTGYFNLCRLPSSYLSLAVTAEAYHAFGFESDEKLTATLAVNNDYTDILSLSFGWNWVQEHNSSATMELYSRYINGPYFAYSINTGFFSLDYFTEATNHFGYAVLSFDIMSVFKPTIWEENNFFISMGFSKLIGLTFQDQELNYPITDNWSVVLRNRYVAGYPTDRSAELSDDPNKVVRLKQGHAMDTLGFEFSCPIEALGNWITPYVSVSLGYMRWDLTELNNMVRGFSLPSLSISFTDGRYGHSFVADIESGITLVPEGLVSFNSCSLTASVFGGLSYVTGDFVGDYRVWSEKRADLDTHGWKDNFLFRWGLSLNFGFDI